MTRGACTAARVGARRAGASLGITAQRQPLKTAQLPKGEAKYAKFLAIVSGMGPVADDGFKWIVRAEQAKLFRREERETRKGLGPRARPLVRVA